MLDKIKSSEQFKENIYCFIGKELPEFELTLLNGKKFSSESLKGKPTVINFWFSNCEPCLEEMPLLNKIKMKFGNDVNFLAITFQKQSEVSEFLKEKEFDFTHIIDSRDYLKHFGFFGYPKTLILDENLTITEIVKMIPKDLENKEKNKKEFIRRITDKLTELKKH